MNRRDTVFALLGLGAAPLAARAQQSAMPVIGFLNGASPGPWVHFVAGFRQGLSEEGFVEGRNVAIEYRWAENRNERLPELAKELVRRQVNVLVATGGDPSALAARAATSNIPIVFSAGGDPVARGLVTSLSRPGGNLTGVALFANLLTEKRFQLLQELVPAATDIALLVNPNNVFLQVALRDAEEAARRVGVRLITVSAATDGDLDAAFTTLVQRRAGALVVAPTPLFESQRNRIVALASRHKVPAIYGFREYATAGGLISYGTNIADVYRQVGVYTGRILKGAKPSDLPVLQPTKFELVVNLKAANGLGIRIPQSLLLRADEVIE